MTQAPPAAELAADLADDGVAVVGVGADDPAFVDSLRDAVAGSDIDGGLGLVVVDETPAQVSVLRDLAQDTLNAIEAGETGAAGPGTVVVRAPGGAGAVSSPETGLARAELDQATLAMVGEPYYPASVGAFSAELADPGVGVARGALILLVALAVLAVAAVAAYRAARTKN
ncbi:Rv1476 family membrane protein [Corynebacterium frankenforstense]